MQSPEERPSTNNSIGKIVVQDENFRLIQKTDRSGFIETESFRELKAFANDALEWMARQRIAIANKRRERQRTVAPRKVQEAKEIPTVKVLDPAIVPTKKSFPPRRVITLVGTFLGLMLATAWTIGRMRWEAVDENDPRKEFATEVFTTVRASLPKFSRNGSADANGHHLGRLPRKAEESSKVG